MITGGVDRFAGVVCVVFLYSSHCLCHRVRIIRFYLHQIDIVIVLFIDFLAISVEQILRSHRIDSVRQTLELDMEAAWIF